jgi:hypothetical protein
MQYTIPIMKYSNPASAYLKIKPSKWTEKKWEHAYIVNYQSGFSILSGLALSHNPYVPNFSQIIKILGKYISQLFLIVYSIIRQ